MSELENLEEQDREVRYNTEKDFYRGIGGELRFKAEGLFKKAKEKSISIEEINITTIKENSVEFPGIGVTELPVSIVRVKGRHEPTGRIIVDGKQIDYYNRYQKYLADRIERNNMLLDDRGRVVRENGRVKYKDDFQYALSDREKFLIGKALVEDKEFGMEKAITGACDRVIRKLMGENDWIYPEEARLLDEEIKSVEERIADEKEKNTPAYKKATERQISYLKSRIKNYGLDPDNTVIINEVLSLSGAGDTNPQMLTSSEMSKIIEGVSDVLPRVKEAIKGKTEMVKQ